MWKFLTRVATGFAVLLGVYLIVRAAAEPFVIAANPSRYADDWGGPSLAGVLAVHMLPGVVSLALLSLGVRRIVRARRMRT